MMRQSITRLRKKGILSTFLVGVFAVLPIVITFGIMAWVSGLLKEWLGPRSIVGKTLSQLGLNFVTDPTVASIVSWVAVLLAIWMLGVLLKSVGKKRIERVFQAVMERVPLVNVFYGPVAQVVDMLQKDPTDKYKYKGMNVVYCGFGREGGTGVLGLLGCSSSIRSTASTTRIARSSTCRRRPYQCLVPSPSKVFPNQYVVPQEEVESAHSGPNTTQLTSLMAHSNKEKENG